MSSYHQQIGKYYGIDVALLYIVEIILSQLGNPKNSMLFKRFKKIENIMLTPTEYLTATTYVKTHNGHV